MGKYKTLVFIAVAVFQFFGPAVGQNSLLNNENSDAQTLERILFINQGIYIQKKPLIGL